MEVQLHSGMDEAGKFDSDSLFSYFSWQLHYPESRRMVKRDHKASFHRQIFYYFRAIYCLIGGILNTY